MRIANPITVPDVSLWTDHILPAEFGDCPSVVVGLYQGQDGGLHPTSLKQCQAVSDSNRLLQVYIWGDITKDPIQQADWALRVIRDNNLPVKWIWGDIEQWWLSWSQWYQMRQGLIPASAVQKATPAALSSHYEQFMARLNSQFPNSGVYTNNGFVASWAPGMNAWLPRYKQWIPEYAHQPAHATQMTWTELRANWLPNYDIALAPGQLPQNVVGLQFTGDVCILPGSYNAQGQAMTLDVSVFDGDWLASLGAVQIPQIPAPTPPQTVSMAYKVIYARVNVRSGPSADTQWMRYAIRDEIVQVVSIGLWAKLADNTYIYSAYLQKVQQ